MIKKLTFVLVLFIGTFAFSKDNLSTKERASATKQLLAAKKFDSIIQILEPIFEKGNCTPSDYMYLIVAHASKSDFLNALVYSKSWLKSSLKKKDTTNILKASRYKTLTFYNLQNIDSSIASAKFSLRFCRDKDSIGMTRSLIGLGLYQLENGEQDSAYHTYSKIKLKNVFLTKKESEYYNSLGMIYADRAQLDSSIYCFKKAIHYFKKLKDTYGVQLLYSNIASSYINLKDYNRALIYLDSTNLIEIGKKDPVFELVYQNYYSLYSNSDSNLKKPDSAFVYLQKIKDLNKFLFQEKMDKEINELTNAYEREADLKNTVMRSKEELAKTKREQLIYIIGILLVIIIAGGTILLLRYRNLKFSRDNLLVNQRLLRSQMTPHFLYNSLSTIQGMILSGKSKTASGYLTKFSKLVRLILQNSRNKIVALSDELEVIKNYLDLQNARFNEGFEYDIKLDEIFKDKNIYIPPMLIQPFVENSIEHGFKNIDRKGKIEISIYFKENSLICEIIDNGIGVNAPTPTSNIPKKESLSTTITSERMELLAKEFKTKTSVIVIDRKTINEQGTKVTLTIPYIYD